MKRIIMFAALALMANLPQMFATTVNDKEEPKKEYRPIDVKKEPSNLHRSLEAPIYAYYIDGTVVLEFVENKGAATVAVQNITAGGQVIELIDTSLGSVIIDIESILTVGDFYMNITTITGDVYYADFYLE